jgi:hypothetical protein
MKPSHTTTPRQLADCTFVTGHGPEPINTGSELLMYAAWVGWLFAVLFGAHFVARVFGG